MAGSFVENINLLASKLQIIEETNEIFEDSNINTTVSNIDKVIIVSDNITDVNTVANSIADVNIVAGKTSELLHLSDNLNKIEDIVPYSTQIQIVGNDLANSYEFIDDYGLITDAVTNESQDISNIETVATNIDDIINTSTFKDDIVVVSTNMGSINTVANIDTKVTVVADNILDVQNAEENARIAKAEAWRAEAERLTANSYATEPEDVFVKIYTSNNDGTFTITDTMDYSAYHWERKATSIVIDGTIDDDIISEEKAYSNSKVVGLLKGKLNDNNGVIDLGSITDTVA